MVKAATTESRQVREGACLKRVLLGLDFPALGFDCKGKGGTFKWEEGQGFKPKRNFGITPSRFSGLQVYGKASPDAVSKKSPLLAPVTSEHRGKNSLSQAQCDKQLVTYRR